MQDCTIIMTVHQVQEASCHNMLVWGKCWVDDHQLPTNELERQQICKNIQDGQRSSKV